MRSSGAGRAREMRGKAEKTLAGAEPHEALNQRRSAFHASECKFYSREGKRRTAARVARAGGTGRRMMPLTDKEG